MLESVPGWTQQWPWWCFSNILYIIINYYRSNLYLNYNKNGIVLELLKHQVIQLQLN